MSPTSANSGPLVENFSSASPMPKSSVKDICTITTTDRMYQTFIEAKKLRRGDDTDQSLVNKSRRDNASGAVAIHTPDSYIDIPVDYPDLLDQEHNGEPNSCWEGALNKLHTIVPKLSYGVHQSLDNNGDTKTIIQSSLLGKKKELADSYSGNLTSLAYQQRTRKDSTEHNCIIETTKICSAKADMLNREQSLINILVYYNHAMNEQTHETEVSCEQGTWQNRTIIIEDQHSGIACTSNGDREKEKHLQASGQTSMNSDQVEKITSKKNDLRSNNHTHQQTVDAISSASHANFKSKESIPMNNSSNPASTGNRHQ